MTKAFYTLLLLSIVPAGVSAQQRPMSPPDRPPVPLKVESPDGSHKTEVANKPAEASKKAAPDSATIKIALPAELAGHHISSGNAVIDALVHEAAARNGLDPCLIISVMRAESGFNRTAVSPKGASGLMQLMPETAARFGVRNIFDPRENILGGATYLRWLLQRFGGDVRLALAGYNAGEGSVEAYGNRIPPFLETQNYVRTIYTRYSTLHLGRALRSEAVDATATSAQAPAPAAQPKDTNPTYNQVIRFTSSSGERSGGA